MLRSAPPHAGPYGAAAMSKLEDMPEAQRLAYALLMETCGDLWAKTVRAADLPALQLRVLEALACAELHLPATEADIKLHGLAHLALDVLPAWGGCATAVARTRAWVCSGARFYHTCTHARTHARTHADNTHADTCKHTHSQARSSLFRCSEQRACGGCCAGWRTTCSTQVRPRASRLFPTTCERGHTFSPVSLICFPDPTSPKPIAPSPFECPESDRLVHPWRALTTRTLPPPRLF
jgi:hypothetical protein